MPLKPKPTPKQRTRPAYNTRRRLFGSDAATARDEVNQEFDRANKIDPDTQTHGYAPGHDTATRETPPGVPDGTRGRRRIRRVG